MKRLDILWLAVFAGISILLLIPATHGLFVLATQTRPYLMGFFKFAVFATLGELLAVRIVSGVWRKLPGLGYKIAVWGLIGVLIVLMFRVFQDGVAGAASAGLLPVGDGTFSPLLLAFFISLIMNLTFAPVFMAAHRMTDTLIDLRAAGERPTWAEVAAQIDWPGFVTFVVGKTVPFFWIPAHTITFLLPAEYRVLYAAYLSIALGAVLAYARRRESQAPILTASGTS